MNKKCSKCNTENPLQAKYCRYCGNKFDEVPEIEEFRLNAVCRVGDVVDFSWEVKNADVVTLNGIVVTGKTHIPVTIKGDEVFKLVAQKGGDKIEKAITVHPRKLQIKEGPKPAPVPSVSILQRKKWTVMIGLLASAILFTVYFYENIIPSCFNISYSGWQDLKPIIKTTCWIVFLFSMVSTIYAKIRKIRK